MWSRTERRIFGDVRYPTCGPLAERIICEGTEGLDWGVIAQPADPAVLEIDTSGDPCEVRTAWEARFGEFAFTIGDVWGTEPWNPDGWRLLLIAVKSNGPKPINFDIRTYSVYFEGYLPIETEIKKSLKSWLLLVDPRPRPIAPRTLQHRREALRLSQRQLGDLLGTPKSTVSAWERGTRTAPLTLEADLEQLEQARHTACRAILAGEVPDPALPELLLQSAQDQARWTESAREAETRFGPLT